MVVEPWVRWLRQLSLVNHPAATAVYANDSRDSARMFGAASMNLPRVLFFCISTLHYTLQNCWSCIPVYCVRLCAPKPNHQNTRFEQHYLTVAVLLLRIMFGLLATVLTTSQRHLLRGVCVCASVRALVSLRRPTYHAVSPCNLVRRVSGGCPSLVCVSQDVVTLAAVQFLRRQKT